MFVLPWFVGVVYHKHYYRDVFSIHFICGTLNTKSCIIVLVSGVMSLFMNTG